MHRAARGVTPRQHQPVVRIQLLHQPELGGRTARLAVCAPAFADSRVRSRSPSPGQSAKHQGMSCRFFDSVSTDCSSSSRPANIVCRFSLRLLPRRSVALAQAHQAAHGVAARTRGVDLVRYSFDTTTFSRPADPRDRLALLVHPAVHKVSSSHLHHPLLRRVALP